MYSINTSHFSVISVASLYKKHVAKPFTRPSFCFTLPLPLFVIEITQKYHNVNSSEVVSEFIVSHGGLYVA